MKKVSWREFVVGMATFLTVVLYFVAYAKSMSPYVRAGITVFYAVSLALVLAINYQRLVWVKLVGVISALILCIGVPVMIVEEANTGSGLVLSVFNLVALVAYILLFSQIRIGLGLSGIVKGASLGGLCCALVYFITARTDVAYAQEWMQRHAYEDFHPNLVGYCFCIFSAVSMLLLAERRKWWLIVTFLNLIIASYISIDVSSRGSLFAVFMGIFVCVGLFLLTAKARIKNGLLALFLVALVGAGALVLVYFSVVAISESDNRMAVALSNKLDLNNKYRGLDSGFTGRFDTWAYAYDMVEAEDLVWGIGFRRSGDIYGAIDNGYIVVLIENGIFVFVTLIIYICLRVVNCSSMLSGKDSLFYIGLISAMVMCLANNFVARYLLAVGNPGAILGMFLLFFCIERRPDLERQAYVTSQHRRM